MPRLSQIQSQLGLAFGSSNAYVEPTSFVAPLQTNLLPTKAAGSNTPTFTRATTKTFTDFEGIVRTALSGEACFEGARRVRNFITNSENLNGANWTKQTGAVVTQISGSEWEIDLSACADGAGVYVQSSITGATPFRASVSLKVAATSGDNRVDVAEPYGSMFTGFTATLTTSWTRFATAVATNTGGSSAGLWVKKRSGGATVFRLKEPQIEEVTGQSNQNPSEYVSVGVLSAPYHGAGVDGVKYFSTKNGNTVSSNVVTEATGAAIGAGDYKADASGPYGYFAEGARTNLLTYSQAFDNAAWTASGLVTAGMADVAVAPDGTTTADKLVESAAAGTHIVYSNTAAGASACVISIYAKANTRSALTVGCNAAGASDWCAAAFNLSGGTAATAQYAGVLTGTSSITAVGNGWYRCVLRVSSSGAAVNQVKFGVSDSATPTFGSWADYSYTGNGTSSIYVWGAQLEAASFASSYIPTTSASVTRNADLLSYTSPLSGLSVGTLCVEATTAAPSGSATLIGRGDGTGNKGPVLYFSSGIHVYIGDGSHDPSVLAEPTRPITSPVKIAASMIAGRVVAASAGAVGAADTTQTAANFHATMQVGATDSGSQLFGTIRNVRCFSRVLSDARLQQLTT